MWAPMIQLGLSGIVAMVTAQTDSLKIYYSDLVAIVESPATTTSIEARAACKVKLDRRSSEATRLLEELGVPDKAISFSDTEIRLKVIGVPAGPIFANKDGQILWSGSGRGRSLGDKELARLRIVLEEISRAYRCGRYAPVTPF